MTHTVGGLGAAVRGYVDRVVNRRDLSAVDDVVAPDYRGGGHGWPADRDALREFYAAQARERPDWRIDVQDTVEVDPWVAVRALAGGTVVDATGASRRRDVEWLAAYRVEDGLIREIRVLSVRDR